MKKEIDWIIKYRGHGTKDVKISYQPIVDGKICSYEAETPEIALLIAIGIKNLGRNDGPKFATFACRMLQIESEWSK